VVWCGVVWCGVVGYGMVWCDFGRLQFLRILSKCAERFWAGGALVIAIYLNRCPAEHCVVRFGVKWSTRGFLFLLSFLHVRETRDAQIAYCDMVLHGN
jgi:hypothetical protein